MSVLRALLFGASIGCSMVHSARADDRQVVVLMPRNLTVSAWPEGTQAVIAELAASHYQVMVESSSAADLRALLQELEAAATQPNAAGAVAVLREGFAGIAYVWTRRDANVVQVHAQTTAGAVGEGALALRVTEILRARDLSLLATPAPTKKKARTREATPLPVADPANDSARTWMWLGAGPTFSSASSAPLVAAVLGARFALPSAPVALDLAVATSLAPLRLKTSAGAVEVGARQLAVYLMYEPNVNSLASFALGLGGGAAWLDESAQPLAGYAGASDHAYAGLLSVRARSAIRSGSLRFLLAVEPGVLLPAVTVAADGAELSRIGHPWASISAGLGWTP